jgi:hypothetical protein
MLKGVAGIHTSRGGASAPGAGDRFLVLLAEHPFRRWECGSSGAGPNDRAVQAGATGSGCRSRGRSSDVALRARPTPGRPPSGALAFTVDQIRCACQLDGLPVPLSGGRAKRATRIVTSAQRERAA